MPLQRRLPKRGFTNVFKKEIAVVNLKDLNRFEASAVVDLEALKNAGLVRKAEGGVKVLGKGDLAQPLTVKVNRVSKTAKEKIESAGGKVELL
jgi:large subunit ribosomal protein L15